MPTVEEISKMIEQLYTMDRIISAMQKKPHDYGGELLYANEAHTLKAIAQSEGISQAELSGQMFRTKGATSVVVDKLAEKGLVVRTREDGNQRRYLLTLTERGWAVHQAHLAYDEAHAAWAAQHLGLSEADLAGVNRSLEQVIQFYSEHYLRSGQPVTPEV